MLNDSSVVMLWSRKLCFVVLIPVPRPKLLYASFHLCCIILNFECTCFSCAGETDTARAIDGWKGRRGLHKESKLLYRIARNFRGTYISWIGL